MSEISQKSDSNSAHENRWQQFNALKWLAILSVGVFVMFLIARIVLLNSYVADIGGIENNVIYSVSKMLNGGTLYENPELGNFNISQYSPIYYFLFYGCCKLFQFQSIEDLQSIYITGRFLSLLFNLFGAILIYRLLSRVFSVHKYIALIAMSLYFLTLTQIHFSARPDGLFSMVFIGCIYAVSVYLRKGKGSYLILASVLAVMSVFIKQNGIQFLVLLPAFFMLVGRYKALLTNLGILLLGTVFFFLSFHWVYGENFLLNTIGGLNNGTSMSRAYYVASHFIQQNALLLIVGAFFSMMWSNKKQPSELRFLAFMLAGLFVFALITSSKIGSWVNYYNEFAIAVILIASIRVDELSRQNDPSNNIVRQAGLFLMLYLSISIPYAFSRKVFEVHIGHFQVEATSLEEKQAVGRYLQNHLEDDKFFLAFDGHINSMLPMQSVVPNKDLVPTQSSFNYAALKQLFDDDRVQFIVIRKGEPLQSMFVGNSLTDYIYVLDYVSDTHLIYSKSGFPH